MKTLYIECRMGCAGDMLMGALSELVDQNAFIQKMNSLGIEGLEVKAVPSTKCGIAGTHMQVKVHGEEEGIHLAVFSNQIQNITNVEQSSLISALNKVEGMQDVTFENGILRYTFDHDQEEKGEAELKEALKKTAPDAILTPLGHMHMHHDHAHEVHVTDINGIIDRLNLDESVKKDAKAVYALIAEAESKAHGMKIDQIHFHEVGTMDALADVVGSCILFHMINADQVYGSAVATGSGMVKCAHGIVPVPAPAAAYLLEGIPTYSGRFEGELCTPTGAALLKYFVNSFDPMPPMVTDSIGYGMGNKDFAAANCVRAFLGETRNDDDTIELVCNLDDETPEELGYAMDLLRDQGALDVYTTSVDMKKSRPGFVFTCMCRASDKEKMLQLMFKHLTTLGIRESTCRRHTLHRRIDTINTSYGPVRVKYASGYGVQKYKYEYDDLAKIATKENSSIDQIRKRIEKEKNENN